MTTHLSNRYYFNRIFDLAPLCLASDRQHLADIKHLIKLPKKQILSRSFISAEKEKKEVSFKSSNHDVEQPRGRPAIRRPATGCVTLCHPCDWKPVTTSPPPSGEKGVITRGVVATARQQGAPPKGILNNLLQPTPHLHIRALPSRPGPLMIRSPLPGGVVPGMKRGRIISLLECESPHASLRPAVS